MLRNIIGNLSDMDRLARHAPALLLAASTTVLLAALGMQHLADIAPCPLCILQRWPYVAVMGLAAVAMVPALPPFWRRALLAAAAIAFAVGGAIAVYHVGVEQGWFAAPASCTGTATDANTIEELRKALAAQPVVRCDQVPWSLFGVSLAGYNVALSALLASFSAVAAARRT
jgi:disulfide bond formation protein DsbB